MYKNNGLLAFALFFLSLSDKQQPEASIKSTSIKLLISSLVGRASLRQYFAGRLSSRKQENSRWLTRRVSNIIFITPLVKIHQKKLLHNMLCMMLLHKTCPVRKCKTTILHTVHPICCFCISLVSHTQPRARLANQRDQLLVGGEF